MITPDDEGNMAIYKVSEKNFKDAKNEMIVLELPLAFVENLGWRNFCSRLELYHPHSKRTCTRYIYSGDICF